MKFKFGNRVKIKSGFYAGRTGKVTDVAECRQFIIFGEKTYRYTIAMDSVIMAYYKMPAYEQYDENELVGTEEVH